MASWAVLASGNGSNFEALAQGLRDSPHHLAALVCDREGAFVFERARGLQVPGYYVSYLDRPREEAEEEILAILRPLGLGLLVLAGFMRLLSPRFLAAFPAGIVNIHPSLLPRHKGTQAIKRSYEAGDEEVGITIHHVNEAMDAGPVIFQTAVRRSGTETLEELEARIHDLEHLHYPRIVRQLLDRLEEERGDLS